MPTTRAATIAACAVCVFSLASETVADAPALAWTLRATTGPSPRAEFGMAYDSERNVTVLFGGANNLDFTSVFPDTWEWNGDAWTLRSDTGPTARCDHAMAFDSARGVTVIFGGYNGSFFGDTWEWDGGRGTWTLRTNTGPSPRADSFMVYDSQRERMVLFGGLRPNLTIAGDTWEYDGLAGTWTQRATTGPAPRWIARMAYDSARGRTVVFGGAGMTVALGDTWEWDGAPQVGVWTQRATTGPSPRYGNGMAFDSHRNLSLIFGGGTTFTSGGGDTWQWDGAPRMGVWTLVPAVGPSPRTFVKMVYDSARCRMVLFGGYGGGQFHNDTWELGADVPGDLNCDGTVDAADLGLVLSVWGSTDPDADLNDDGIVNSVDLGILLGHWSADE